MTPHQKGYQRGYLAGLRAARKMVDERERTSRREHRKALDRERKLGGTGGSHTHRMAARDVAHTGGKNLVAVDLHNAITAAIEAKT